MAKWLYQAIVPPDPDFATAAEERQRQLTKPPGSLGYLEQLAIRVAAMQRTQEPRLARVRITVFAADHGVAAEGVSAFPQAVTGEMVRNFARGGAAISVLARSQGCDLEVVNVGTVNQLESLPGVIDARIGPGTSNLARGPAMTEVQLEAAFEAGRMAATRAEEAGAEMFIGAEMGIANTTAATAVGCALTGADAAALTGPGTGLDASGVAHKIEVIQRALARVPDTGPHMVLRELGGFEIVALAGAYLSCAQRRIPVLVDGFIASAAALAAVRLNAGLADWLFFAHVSAEPGHRAMLDALGGRPLLDLDMRLGEGSGAAVALSVLRSAVALHGGMATFADAGVST